MPIPLIGDAATQRLSRIVVFIGLYAVLFIIYLGIVPAAALGRSTLSGWMMESVASAYAILILELPAVGDLAPALFAGIVLLTATPRQRNIQVLLLLVATAAIFLVYLHLQMFLGQDNIAELIGAAPEANRMIRANLEAFAGQVRSFMAIVFGGLLGVQFGKSMGDGT